MPITRSDFHSFNRNQAPDSFKSTEQGLVHVRTLFATARYNEALNALEILLDTFKADSKLILLAAHSFFTQLTKTDSVSFDLNNRYRFCDCSALEKSSILTVTTKDFLNNSGFLPFLDKQFDFIFYCDPSPQTTYKQKELNIFLREVQRVAKSGYIELPKQSSTWNSFVETTTLNIFEGTNGTSNNLVSVLLDNVFAKPESNNERALAALKILKPSLFNTTFFWESDFEFKINDIDFLNTPQVVKNDEPICVFLATYYQGFLENHYTENKNLSSLPFEQQIKSLTESNFGDSNFYSAGLATKGWKTCDIVTNSPYANQSWLEEYGRNSDENTLIQQLKHIDPEVVYIQDMHSLSAYELNKIKKHTKIIIGQIASSFSSELPVHLYDFVVSSLPLFVEYFRSRGVPCYYQPLAFDPSIAKNDSTSEWEKRPYELSFVGTFAGKQHPKRQKLLEYLGSSFPLHIWGTGTEHLAPESPLHNCLQGEAWGQEMFDVLLKSKITINIHGDCFLPEPDSRNATLEHANNMRLFEATGCGALLITEYSPNLAKLFKLGEEIVTYSSFDECLSLIKYYHQHPKEAKEIALRGQKRTLLEHTYLNRMNDLAQWIERTKRRKVRNSHLSLSEISGSFENIMDHEITEKDKIGWLDPSIPNKQRSLVEEELNQLYHGETIKPFKVLYELIKDKIEQHDTIVEIGCSSGYYSEVMEYLTSLSLQYHGIDISESMIRLARKCYPNKIFSVAKGSNLAFEDKAFRWVVSGCVLLHDPEYFKQIQETCRIAEKYVVAHRTPIHKASHTSFYRKKAYGVQTVEIRFNETLIVNAFLEAGFEVEKKIEYESDPINDRYETSYLLSRRA
jgi:protein-L-isoaspartate O-methyltransferase